ncbi:MAG: T9SS type A sorting domain-containing protein [Ignavibacteria bacterium]|nr:T9SS type A sorting domain-containing protein [Ignavibacteria bacterium]
MNKELNLSHNYPNPSSSETTFQFSVAEPSPTVIDVVDALGTTMNTVVNEYLPIGNYERIVDTRTLTSGVYFFRLNNGNVHAVSRFMVVR